MPMKPFLLRAWWIKYSLIGALVFWSPDVILHAIRGERLSRLLLTVLLPALGVPGMLVLRVVANRERRKWVALLALVGTWVTGGLACALGATFGGVGFFTGGGWELALVGALPPMLFIAATYDGSLFGLLIYTALAAPLIIRDTILEKD